MRTLRRYLGREIANATLFVLAALVGIFSLFDLINELGDLGRSAYRFGAAVLHVLLLVPGHAYDLMPIAALIGTIYALSKLASNSEFTIMRVSGMSTRRLVDAVFWVGIGFAVLTYVFGEVVAPPAEELAQRLKAHAVGAPTFSGSRSGIWVRDVVPGAPLDQRMRFVNVQRVRNDGEVDGWRIFSFDRSLRLRSITTAVRGQYLRGQGWMLTGVVETRYPAVTALGPVGTAPSTGIARPAGVVADAASAIFTASTATARFSTTAASTTTPIPAQTRILQTPARLWKSDLTPEIFGVLLVEPENLSGYSLYRYIQHLDENHQRTERYTLALWQKVFYPPVVIVMMALALPFAYLHVRAGTVSLKIFAGIMIGVVFYAINKIFSNLGLINTWPPVVVAALPGMVAFTIALGALYWVERR